MHEVMLIFIREGEERVLLEARTMILEPWSTDQGSPVLEPLKCDC